MCAFSLLEGQQRKPRAGRVDRQMARPMVPQGHRPGCWAESSLAGQVVADGPLHPPGPGLGAITDYILR